MEGGGEGRGYGGRGRGGGRNHGGGRGRGGGGRGDGGGYDQNYQNQYRESGGGGGGYGRGRNRAGEIGGVQNGGGGGYGRGRNSAGGRGGYSQNGDGGGGYNQSGDGCGYGRGGSDQNDGGGGYGRGRNNGSGGGGGYDQNHQAQYRESGDGGGGRGRGYESRPPQQQQGRGNGGGYESRPPQQGRGSGGGRGGWKQSASSLDQPQQQVSRPPQPQPQPPSPIADSVEADFKSLKISEGQLPTLGKLDGKSLPIRRPDQGTLAVRSVRLYANHFPVTFDPRRIVMHYDVEIKQVAAPGSRPFKKSIPKHLMHAIKDKLFATSSHQFPVDMVAYDGEKNIFSAVELPVGVFRVDFSGAEDNSGCSYSLTIKEVSRLELGKLKEYLGGTISSIPRDILQSLDLVMKDNPSKCRISVGKSFYCKNYRSNDDFHNGLAAYRGLYQSLKPTSQGLSLCLDYSVLAFRKPWPVLDFLNEHLQAAPEDIGKWKKEAFMAWKKDVTEALKGLKVTVTHRRTKQKYVVLGLTTKNTRELSFQLDSPDSSTPPQTVNLADYFWQKYEKRIKYLDIPCLDIGKPGKPNHVPMEFCVLLEGQRYEKEDLAKLDRGYTAGILRNMSLAKPAERQRTIYEMVQARDGPCGAVAHNFDLEVEKNMTKVLGRVLGAPDLKLRALNGNVCRVTVDRDKCHWNLMRNSVPEGQRVERWALIDFTVYKGRSGLHVDGFIEKLKARSSKLGMYMEEPVVKWGTGMHDLSSVSAIKSLLSKVVNDATMKGCPQDKPLQLIVCVMSNRDPGYKILKWVSEVQIGIITQCCLSNNAGRAQDQFLANLCLKINAKVGGSNVELNERLPHFSHDDSVMFIGADVNHPAASNSTCPSIAAVVGSINWPATNKYAAKIQPQAHRKEKIVNFGSICRDLISTYAQHNGSKPKKIIVFRDGVSEGQFDMALNEELVDMVKAISDDHYQPYITLVVAQKRHNTRLFAAGMDERSPVENVPPGTVVDTKIIHPFEFDFYLCSHLGSIGTSKPTHYYVLWDDNRFTSDELQKLIYNLCFTYARCTKPVSLVPPVYYADLVAYRGRLFQEVAMLPPESGNPVPSSFDQSFYTLHENLRDVMHFI